MTEELTPVEIFCSYANADEMWLRKLETHLSLLQRQGLISLWHNRLIAPGTDWGKALDTHLETASVILLLVSADFFASDYCYGTEMKRALERQEAEEARVIPVLVRPADWNGAPFAHLQALPTDAKPIAFWPDKDAALADVAAGVRRVIVEDLPQFTASAPRSALPAIWNIPYPRNPFFLGRNAELSQIHSHLLSGQTTALSQPQAISGLGGIGKTQLVLEYAYRYHQDYTAVLWARAESTEALISSYVTLATLLRLPEREAKEQEITVQAVRTWLQTHRAWLLILDNADDLALLPEFLPPTLAGHLLLTTRAAATGRLAHRLEIETLPPKQGALFLLRRAALLAPDAELSQIAKPQQELAMQISQELGGLPLALDQAGAYLEETGTDLGGYLRIFQHHRVALLQKRGGLIADHPAPVTTTWSLSFQRVEEKTPAAADLLRVCALLSPDVIPEELLTEGARFLGPKLAAGAKDAFGLNQAIEALRAYSLVQRDPGGKTLSIHRLVQAVLQDTLSETERHTWAERILLAVNAAFPVAEHRAWPQCERLLSQALATAHLIEQEHLVGEEAGRLLHETAAYLYERAHNAEAEPLFRRALYIREQLFGPQHLLVASSLSYLALHYRWQGKHIEAEPLFQRALSILKQRLGPEHLEIAFPLEGLADLYRQQGKYGEARPLFQQALHIREDFLGPSHPLTASSLRHLADLSREQGKYAEAEHLYRRALNIWELQPGSPDPQTAYALTGLARLSLEQGKYVEAGRLFQQALNIREQLFGPFYPGVASALIGLAETYLDQGKYAEAEPLFQRAMDIWEHHRGPNPPWIAHPLTSLANLYREQGKYAEAEPLYQRAVSIREKFLGSQHPLLAYPLAGLANLYREQGKYAEAEPLYQWALHIWEQQLGPQHSVTAEVISDLARLWETQGNSEEARTWYVRALVVREQVLGMHHPRTTETRTRLIALLYAMGQHEEAAKMEEAQSEP